MKNFLLPVFALLGLAQAALADSTPTASALILPPSPAIRRLSFPFTRTHNEVVIDVSSALPKLVRDSQSGNPATRLAAIAALGAKGPAAIRATPLLKQNLSLSDTDTKKALMDALWAILNPNETSAYFFEMDNRTDLEKANFYGPVKRVVWDDLDSLRKRETDYDREGYLQRVVFFDLTGWERSRTEYVFDRKEGRLKQTDRTRAGTVTGVQEFQFNPQGDLLKQAIIQGDQTTVLETRDYEYYSPGKVSRMEDQTNATADPQVFTFSLDSRGHVVDRRVARGFNGVEEETVMEFDAKGNTTAKWEYVSLPALGGEVEAGPLKEQPNRKVLKYRWEYSYNDLDEKIQQKLYWDDGVLMVRISRFEYDPWRNMVFEECRDTDNNILYENRFKYDQWRNLLSTDYYDHVGNKSHGETTVFEGMDNYGNWTSQSNWGSSQRRTALANRTLEYYAPDPAAALLTPTAEPIVVPTPFGNH